MRATSPKSTDPLKAEVKRLFSEFLPLELGERFGTLLDMDPKRWRKIDPWKLWGVESPRIHPWPQRPALSGEEFLRQPAIASLEDEPVTVLRCGHSEPSLTRETLRAAFSREGWILEGFASVTNYKLGFAFNHDGMVLILSTRAPTGGFQGPNPLQGWAPERRSRTSGA